MSILVALALVALCGMGALAIDGGMVFNERRNAQIAADHAALAAAWASCHASSPVAAGLDSASKNGFDNDGVANTVSIADLGGKYEATIASTIQAAFAGVVGANELTATARAVAECTTGGGGQYAIFANSQSCSPKTLDWSGSNNNVTGAVHSNRELYMGGSSNSVLGGTTYVSSFTNGGSGNVFDPPPAGIGIVPLPVEFNIADYMPGGVRAVGAGSQYYNFGGAKITKDALEDRGLWNEATQTLATGLYFTQGDIEISGNRTNGTATFVTSQGLISFSGEQDLEPWDPDGLLAFSNRDTNCFDFAINVAGSNSRWRGIIYAPLGMAELNGSNNSTLFGSVIADTVKLNGSNIVFNATDDSAAGPPSVRLLE